MSQDEKEMLKEFERMQKRADLLFNQMFPTLRLIGVHHQKTWRPPTDVYETDDSIIVKVEIAGMSEKDFSISISNRNLLITGVRHDPEYKLAYQQLEIPYGHFRTEVFLPHNVNYDQVGATYENGFLTVVLPKARVHRVRIVEKNAGDTTG